MIKWKLAAALVTLMLPGAGSAAQPAASQPAPADRRAPPRLIAGSISNMDYPSAAIRAGEQGSVHMELRVAADGSVASCEVLETSGSQVLDQQSCALATQRFLFEPGRNSEGAATASRSRHRVRWVLPDDAPGGDGFPFVRFAISITATLRDGQVASCTTQSMGPSEPRPIEHCQRVFAQYPTWDLMRTTSSSVTHLMALTPQGTAAPDIDPRWGAIRVENLTDLVIGPDGRVISCTLPGDRPMACPGESVAVPLFDPAADPERRARLTGALFSVPIR